MNMYTALKWVLLASLGLPVVACASAPEENEEETSASPVSSIAPPPVSCENGRCGEANPRVDERYLVHIKYPLKQENDLRKDPKAGFNLGDAGVILVK